STSDAITSSAGVRAVSQIMEVWIQLYDLAREMSVTMGRKAWVTRRDLVMKRRELKVVS
ncbi:15347_t:CDS:2, partial [Rhizophagus irregularis]